MRAFLATAAVAVVTLFGASAFAGGLAMTPATASVEPGDHLTFKPVGGSGDYRWSLLEAPSGGTIDEQGNYVAGPKDADDIVVLADPAGNTTQATVHVVSGINLAGGADGDNGCAVGAPGSSRSGFGAAALALGLAVSLTRRRRD